MKRLIIYSFLIFLLFFIISLLLKNNNKSTKNVVNNNKYSVEFSPCGVIEFEKVPEKILTSQESYNDILISFNKGSNIKAVNSADKFYYEFFNDLKITNILNKNGLIQISTGRNTYDKELFYSVNANIHHIDPVTLAMTKSWGKSDVEEISKNIGPFFANRYSIENKKPNHLKDYKFYTLDEINLKFGEVYKKEMTAKKINEFTEKFILSIKNKLPKKSKPKSIAIVYLCKKGIVPFNSTSNGYGFSQYKIFKCEDAFKNKGIKTYSYEGNFGTMLDKETLLLANPDIIIINEGIYIDKKYKFFSRRTEILLNEFNKFKNDQLLKDVPAFKNNNIILGGVYDQGPITRIYQIEMLAKQLYPEIFGKFKENHNYKIEEQLFSRDELRRIINE